MSNISQLKENEIYLGDCLELMKQIPDKSIDCVITDPPYGIGFMYECKEKIDNPKEYGEFLSKILFEANRITKDDAFMCFFQAQKYFRYFWEWFGEDIRIFISAKNFVQLRKTHMNYGYDPVVFKIKGNYKVNNKPENNLDYDITNTAGLVSDISRPEREHPAPRTLDVMKRIISNFTNENDLILDPFLGSGTTAIAAYDLKRRYIGIEKEPKYYEIAKKRIEEFKAQLRMF